MTNGTDIALLPQVSEMEDAVIGALILEGESFSEVVNILHEACFYSEKHQKVWAAMKTLYTADQPIDSYTVFQKLLETGYGGKVTSQYLIDVSNKIGSSAHIEHHAMMVKEKYLQRKLIQVQQNSLKKLYEGEDFFEQYDKLLTELDSINSEITRIQSIPFRESVIKRVEQIKKAGADHTYKTGICSYLDALDRQTRGFQTGNLIIIAGRPSMGKTALAVDFAHKQSTNNISVGFFSLEMSCDEIIDRILAANSGVDMKQISRGGMKKDDWGKVDTSMYQMVNYPIVVCDKGGLTINEIISIAKNWKVKNKIQILYIDYLQLISSLNKKEDNREREISNVSRRLKQLAKELQIPVVALAQLNRQVESRAEKRPLLSDLRESGSIEQDADLVIFPFREEYYNKNAEVGLCELDIAKYRNGKPCMVKCIFEPEYQRFKDYEQFTS